MRAAFAFLALFGVFAVSGPPVDAQAPAPGTSVPTAPRSATGPTAGRGAAPNTGTAVIRGRVVAADTGAPVARAQVRVVGLRLAPGEASPIFFTDEQGRYEIKDLPAGRFTVSATKNGYLTMVYGQKQPADTSGPLTATDAPADVADGQTLDRIDFTLPRGGVVIARVTDDFGDPIAGVSVRAERYRFTNGTRSLVSTTASSTTDDRGEVRLSNIVPDDYYISASGIFVGRGANLDASNSGRIYGTGYYPGTSSIKDAQMVSVRVGLEANVSFSMVPVRSSSVSGNVRTSDGSVPVGASIRWFSTVNVIQPLAPDGSFSFPNLSPGEFTLNISPGSTPQSTQEWARLRLNLTGENITGLIVTTSKGTTLRGQVVFDTPAPPPGLQPENVAVTAVAALPDSNPLLGRPVAHRDWSFEITGVMGSVMLRPRLVADAALSGWVLKAVKLDGKDVTDVPLELNEPRDVGDFEVVLTQRKTELSGSVTNGRGESVTDYATLVFPEDREQWGWQSRFVAVGRPDQRGAFKISGLPPGRYLAAVVESLDPGDERDPDVLEGLRTGATRLTLAEGETRSISLRMNR